MGLEGILGAKFAGSFSDCDMVSVLSKRSQNNQDILSSCRLSIRACFWFRVIRIFFLEGLPVGVLIPSSDASSMSEDLRLRVDAAILAMIVKAVG